MLNHLNSLVQGNMIPQMFCVISVKDKLIYFSLRNTKGGEGGLQGVFYTRIFFFYCLSCT